MKTAVRLNLKSKTLFSIQSYKPQRNKEIYSINFKFYQKLFVVLFFLPTFLIFPDSPRELENICLSYNSSKVCNVW